MRQIAGITPVGFDPSPPLNRSERRSNDLASDPERFELPGQPEAGGSGFLATTQRVQGSEAVQGFEQSDEIIGDRRQRLRGLSVAEGHGDRDRIARNVETNEPKCGNLTHGPVLPVSALR